MTPLHFPRKVYNVDGTANRAGMITHVVFTTTKMGQKTRGHRYYITDLGVDNVILGLPWLRSVNPDIDWDKGILIDNAESLKTVIQTTTVEEPTPLVQEIPYDDDEEDDADLLKVYWQDDEDPLYMRKTSNFSQSFAQDFSQPTTTDLDKLPPYLQDLRTVFEKKAAERFPVSRSWDHAIDLKPDFVPKNCKIYPLSPKEQLAMDDFLEENLKKGYIRPSQSPMASPFFFVGKKDGGMRPCQDYRYLNEGTVKNAYPLPLISELMDQLKGATIFTKMDLRSEYNNVRIKDGDQWKAAFKTNWGLFEPTVMFFGLCNSPATFQAMMNDLFRDMIDEGWLVIYMDDILIASNDLEEHRRRTRMVVNRLHDNDLFLKLEKCYFEVPKVEFLGLIIQDGELAMDPAKLKGIADWPAPTTVKGVRAFLGFGNFYRKFIHHYSALARPLIDLTKTKGGPTWEWTERQQEAFDKLKARFLEAPVLAMSDQSRQFILESDASKYAAGAVLRQRDVNGDLHPCAYLSKSFACQEHE
jgi:hypothetical protein